MVTVQEIRTLLERIEFPATKAAILEDLLRNHAPESVLVRVREIPEHRYGSVDSVVDTLRRLE